MSGENATNESTEQADKPGSAITAAADTSKNGATGNETPETKPDAKAAGKGAGNEGAGDEKPPEAFDFTKWEPKPIEGVKRDPKVLETVRKAFGDLKLSGEQAQKLMDLSDAQMKAATASWEQAQLKQVEDSRAQGWDTLRKEFGSDLDAKLGHVRKAIGGMGKHAKAVADRLYELGLDNDPVLARGFAELGSKLGEDSVGDTARKPGGDQPDTFEDRVKRTYGKTKES